MVAIGTLLRYPYEVRGEDEYFDDIQDVKLTKDMLDLAKHIVQQKTSGFDPEKFEDRYESALAELINRKRNGERITAAGRREMLLPISGKATSKSKDVKTSRRGFARGPGRRVDAMRDVAVLVKVSSR